MESKFKKGDFAKAIVPGFEGLGEIQGEIKDVVKPLQSEEQYSYWIQFDLIERQFFFYEGDLKPTIKFDKIALYAVLFIIIISFLVKFF